MLRPRLGPVERPAHAMTLDIDRLRHAAFLATGEALTTGDAERLGRILSTPEELLPHLLLRRGGFQASPLMRGALEAAIARAPGGHATARIPDYTDVAELTAARDAVKAAVKTLIDHDLANEAGHASLDRALADLASRDGAAGPAPHLRIRR